MLEDVERELTIISISTGKLANVRSDVPVQDRFWWQEFQPFSEHEQILTVLHVGHVC